MILTVFDVRAVELWIKAVDPGRIFTELLNVLVKVPTFVLIEHREDEVPLVV